MSRRVLPALGAIVALSVAFSGCLTVYPVKSLLSTDPRNASIVFENHLAFEARANPSTFGTCNSSSETRGILVPQRSQWVNVSVVAVIDPAPALVETFLNRHFDLTVTDGSGTVWVEIHLQNNDTRLELRIDGPRPGGWTVALSYNICDGNSAPFNVDDQFTVEIVVRQPA